MPTHRSKPQISVHLHRWWRPRTCPRWTTSPAPARTCKCPRTSGAPSRWAHIARNCVVNIAATVHHSRCHTGKRSLVDEKSPRMLRICLSAWLVHLGPVSAPQKIPCRRLSKRPADACLRAAAQTKVASKARHPHWGESFKLPIMVRSPCMVPFYSRPSIGPFCSRMLVD
jgi:hypothetical protein